MRIFICQFVFIVLQSTFCVLMAALLSLLINLSISYSIGIISCKTSDILKLKK